MKQLKRPKPKPMTQQHLRTIARDVLAKFLNGESLDTNRSNAAMAVLHAPDRRGE